MTLLIQVRPAEPDDWRVLTEFNLAMARETEERTLQRETVASGVRRMLERPEAGFYLIAESDGQIVGSLMVTFEWSDWRDGFFWWIQSVYVAPEYRRRGVFRRLYEQARTQADQNPDVCGLRLYVEDENHAAQQTYAALGMKPTPYRLYECEFDNRES